MPLKTCTTSYEERLKKISRDAEIVANKDLITKVDAWRRLLFFEWIEVARNYVT